jgi:hypothetical protein
MAGIVWPTEGPLSGQLPASDLLLQQLLDTVADVVAHDHGSNDGIPDLYCLNLTSYAGSRMGAVLKRLADVQAELKRVRARELALADHAGELLEEAQSGVDAPAD